MKIHICYNDSYVRLCGNCRGTPENTIHIVVYVDKRIPKRHRKGDKWCKSCVKSVRAIVRGDHPGRTSQTIHEGLKKIGLI